VCNTWTGDPTSAIAETSPGGSGLQYQGNGNWQFNWQTSKSWVGSRAGAVPYGPSPTPATSNGADGFPVRRSPAGFASRVMWPIALGVLSSAAP
jgi:hypothetical protein